MWEVDEVKLNIIGFELVRINFIVFFRRRYDIVYTTFNERVLLLCIVYKLETIPCSCVVAAFVAIGADFHCFFFEVFRPYVFADTSSVAENLSADTHATITLR